MSCNVSKLKGKRPGLPALPALRQVPPVYEAFFIRFEARKGRCHRETGWPSQPSYSGLVRAILLEIRCIFLGKWCKWISPTTPWNTQKPYTNTMDTYCNPIFEQSQSPKFSPSQNSQPWAKTLTDPIDCHPTPHVNSNKPKKRHQIHPNLKKCHFGFRMFRVVECCGQNQLAMCTKPALSLMAGTHWFIH